jgi:hypothetical protein
MTRRSPGTGWSPFRARASRVPSTFWRCGSGACTFRPTSASTGAIAAGVTQRDSFGALRRSLVPFGARTAIS